MTAARLRGTGKAMPSKFVGPSLPPREINTSTDGEAKFRSASAWQARCAALSKESLQCLADNNYDKSKCAVAFERYRACLKRKRNAEVLA